MKLPILYLTVAALTLVAAEKKTDIYTADDLKSMETALAGKGGPFASKDLQRYGNHYTMLAHRSATGSSEVHEHEADVFVVVHGQATIVTGGTMVHPTTTKPGEIRGTSISGGERHTINEGSIIHIPANTPHQLLVPQGQQFTYFVVKVTGQ